MPLKISRLPQGEFLKKEFSAIKTPYFSLKAKKNNAGERRIGVIVGKAVHKSAVKRNFLKRQAKTELSKLINPGSDLLMIFSPGTNKLTKRQLKEEITKAAARIRQ